MEIYKSQRRNKVGAHHRSGCARYVKSWPSFPEFPLRTSDSPGGPSLRLVDHAACQRLAVWVKAPETEQLDFVTWFAGAHRSMRAPGY